MSKSIYLINPEPDFLSYNSAEVFAQLGLGPTALIANLAITTVAALVPDDFIVELCDQHISTIDLDHPADFIGIAGNSSQVGNMIKLAEAFRGRGKTVIIGGPYASLSPETVRSHCDILVLGEIEAIAPQFFDDLRHGRWQAEYIGGHPDLELSPIPRWDLYPNENALQGCVQTSRGCPHECEFCDVIHYVGRRQRHKSVGQVLDELEVLYKFGYRRVFLADDNFAAFRERTKELLVAIRDWNKRQTDGWVNFSTQGTITMAADEDILQLCYEAGMMDVFVGIETPNEDSLRETKKLHNIGINLVEQTQRFLDHGIDITAGMIVGFDADGLDIFERQYEFAMSTSLPTILVSVLVAPNSTPLYERLKSENRLVTVGQTGANTTPWSTNIIPKQMTRDELFAGMRWLGNRLYHPKAYGERLLRFIDDLKTPGLNHKEEIKPTNRELVLRTVMLVRRIAQLGPEEAQMLSKVVKKMSQKPGVQKYVMSNLIRYMQVRYMYENHGFWDPGLAEQAAPDFSAVRNIPPASLTRFTRRTC